MKDKSNFEKFTGIYCSGLFIPNSSMLTSLCILFDQVYLCLLYTSVFSAHLHMDEATPHLHIDFVPFTTGSKRGLDTRVSLKPVSYTHLFFIFVFEIY